MVAIQNPHSSLVCMNGKSNACGVKLFDIYRDNLVLVTNGISWNNVS